MAFWQPFWMMSLINKIVTKSLKTSETWKKTDRNFHWVLSLQWHHNGRDGISNHQRHNCLLNCQFMRRSKKTSKLHITGLCEGNSLVTGEIPSQRASYAENVSIWPAPLGAGPSASKVMAKLISCICKELSIKGLILLNAWPWGNYKFLHTACWYKCKNMNWSHWFNLHEAKHNDVF